jgi:hypothetical protein
MSATVRHPKQCLGLGALLLAACGRIWYTPIHVDGGGRDAAGQDLARDQGGDADGGAADTATGGVGGGSGGASGAAGTAGTGDGGTAGTGGAAGASDAGAADGAGGGGGAPCMIAAFGGHAYAFCDGPLSWNAAEADCEVKGMHLVRIDDAQENDWLEATAFANVAGGSNVQPVWRWIGANDQAVAGEWRWTDGTLFFLGKNGGGGSAQNGLFANWAGGSPSGGGTGKSCAGIEHLPGGLWGDALCAALQPYVCEQ